MFTQRLDNFLVQNGFCSKRSAKNFVLKNQIFVNDVLEKNHKEIINPQSDIIRINEKIIPKTKHFYFMINKPQDYVCSSVSDRSKVIYELFEKIKISNPYKFNKLHTVGRLDKNTEGLLLLTTDGNFSNYITRKENKITKTYYVELEKKISKEEQLLCKEKFEQGIFLSSEKKSQSFTTLPAKINWISENSCNLTITEGKFHQVRRMFLAINNQVTFLKRIAIGKLKLDSSLKIGEYKKLSKEEIEQII